MKRNISIIAAAMLAFAACAQQLTTSEFVGSILANNPSLMQLQASQQSQVVRSTAEARSLAPTEMEYEGLWATGTNKWNAGVTQSFDWPGTYAKRREAARANAQVLSHEYTAEAVEVRRQVLDNLNGYFYCSDRLALIDSLTANMDRLQAYVEKGFDLGQLTVLDVRKIRLEKARLSLERQAVVSDRTEHLGALAALNGGPLAALPETFDAPILQPVAVYLTWAESLNPAVLAADSRVRRAAAQAGADKPMPGFSVGYRHAFEENTHFNGFSIGLDLPLFTRNKARQAALLEVKSQAFARYAAVAEGRASVEADYATVTQRLEAVRTLDANTLAADYPALLLKAFNGGLINVITYIQEANYYLEAREQLLESRFELNKALISLDRFAPLD